MPMSMSDNVESIIWTENGKKIKNIRIQAVIEMFMCTDRDACDCDVVDQRTRWS